MTTSGSPIQEIATDNHHFIPPENVPTLAFLTSLSLTDFSLESMTSDTLFSGTPLILQNILICSSAVSKSHRISNYGTTPIICQISSISSLISKFLNFAVPSVGASIPVSTLIKVLFPAPL